MIKHIVMWKLKESAEGADRYANALKMKTMLESLKGKIKEIKKFEVGININSSADAYDVVLYSEFTGNEGLLLYQNHPEHLKAGEFIGKVRLERKVVDYKVPGEGEVSAKR